MAKPIKISILGDVSDLEKKLRQGDKSLESFGDKAARIGKRVAQMGAVVAAAGAAVGGALLAVGDTFRDVTNSIIVGTGASGQALEDLEDSAKRVGKTTPSTFADIGTAIADVNTRLGLTGAPLEDMTSRFLNLSRITGTDLQANIANASRVFGDWGIVAADQPAALDAIFEATKRTGIGLDRLTTNVVQFGAPLRQFGYSFEESLALFGKWEQEGVNTEVVLSGLKQALGRFSDAGKDPERELARVTDAIKNAGSAGEANALAIEAFGMRAGPDMAAAVREGRFELGDMASALENAGGAIDDADQRTRTFSESWQVLKNKVLVALEPIATRVFDAVSAGMEKLSDWWDEHGEDVIDGLRRVAAFFRALGETVADVVRWIVRNWDTIRTVALVVAAVLSPLLLLLAAQFVAVGVAAVVSAGRQVVAWAMSAAAAVKGAASAVIASYRVVGSLILMGATAVAQGAKIAAVWTAQIVASAVRGAAAFAVAVARVVAGWVLMAAQSLIAAARVAAAWLIAMGPIGWVIAAVVGLVALIVANWDKVKKWTGAAWDWVVGKVVGAWTWIRNAVVNGAGAVVGFVRGLPGRIVGALGNFGRLLWSKGVDLIRGLVNGIGSAAGYVGNVARNIVNGIIGFVNRNIISGINNLLEFTVLGVHINPPDIPHIPYLADGAIVDEPTLAVVGEDGPEAVIPLSANRANRRRSLMDQAGLSESPARAGDGGDVYHVNVNVQGTRASARDIADEAIWALKTAGR